MSKNGERYENVSKISECVKISQMFEILFKKPIKIEIRRKQWKFVEKNGSSSNEMEIPRMKWKSVEKNLLK